MLASRFCLRERKLGTKTVLNGVDFIDPVLGLHILAAVSDVAEFNHGVSAELTLITETPGINITRAEIRREREYRVVIWVNRARENRG